MNNKFTGGVKPSTSSPSVRSKRNKSLRKTASVLFCLGGALMLFRGTATAYTQGLLAPDGVYIPENQHNFRDQKRGELAHTFRIYNLRARYLDVEAITGCGCTEVSWENATIAPFGWRDITATMEDTSKKNVTSSVTIKTNSNPSSYLFLRLMKAEGQTNLP